MVIREIAVACAAVLASGCMAEVDDEDVSTAELDEFFDVCEQDPGSTVRVLDPRDPTVYAEAPCALFTEQAIREPKHPIREPPPGFDGPRPDWYEPSLYGGPGVWGPGRDSPRGGGGSGRDWPRGPGRSIGTEGKPWPTGVECKALCAATATGLCFWAGNVCVPAAIVTVGGAAIPCATLAGAACISGAIAGVYCADRCGP